MSSPRADKPACQHAYIGKITQGQMGEITLYTRPLTAQEIEQAVKTGSMEVICKKCNERLYFPE